MPTTRPSGLAVAALAALVLLPNLGGPPLWDEDEPKNAACTLAMLARNDWVVPTFNGRLRIEKPALVNWVQIAGCGIAGRNEAGLRLGSAVLTIGSWLMTWRIGGLLAGAGAGLGVAVLLLSASNVVHWASLSAFLAGVFSYLVISVDNALLQAGCQREMQGRINAIANLTKGLQSLSLAAAGYTIHLLVGSHRFGSGYQLVQVSLAVGLLAGIGWLWPRLVRFQAS